MRRLTEQIIDKETGRVTGYKPIGNRNAFQICNRLGKYEDAIREIQERIALIDSDYSGMEDYKEVLELAVEALGKQMPKNAEIKTFDEEVNIGNIKLGKGVKIHYCPVCETFLHGTAKYCDKCGQRVMRSDKQ